MYHLKIITTHKTYAEMDVDKVTLLTSDGYITMLSNHMDTITTVENGVMRITVNKEITSYAISSGLFTFKDNQAILLIDTIERSDEVDVKRAEAAKERAEARIKNHESADEVKRGELALKRAITRLKINQ